MDKLKQLLESLDVRPIVAKLNTQDKVLVTGVLLIALAVGLYLGYDAEVVLDWLGL